MQTFLDALPPAREKSPTGRRARPPHDQQWPPLSVRWNRNLYTPADCPRASGAPFCRHLAGRRGRRQL